MWPVAIQLRSNARSFFMPESKNRNSLGNLGFTATDSVSWEVSPSVSPIKIVALSATVWFAIRDGVCQRWQYATAQVRRMGKEKRTRL